MLVVQLSQPIMRFTKFSNPLSWQFCFIYRVHCWLDLCSLAGFAIDGIIVSKVVIKATVSDMCTSYHCVPFPAFHCFSTVRNVYINGVPYGCVHQWCTFPTVSPSSQQRNWDGFPHHRVGAPWVCPATVVEIFFWHGYNGYNNATIIGWYWWYIDPLPMFNDIIGINEGINRQFTIFWWTVLAFFIITHEPFHVNHWQSLIMSHHHLWLLAISNPW